MDKNSDIGDICSNMGNMCCDISVGQIPYFYLLSNALLKLQVHNQDSYVITATPLQCRVSQQPCRLGQAAPHAGPFREYPLELSQGDLADLIVTEHVPHPVRREDQEPVINVALHPHDLWLRDDVRTELVVPDGSADGELALDTIPPHKTARLLHSRLDSYNDEVEHESNQWLEELYTRLHMSLQLSPVAPFRLAD